MPLTFATFKRYRLTHPGPSTKKAFQVWKSNGGRDYENFKWKKNKNNNKKKNNSQNVNFIFKCRDSTFTVSHH